MFLIKLRSLCDEADWIAKWGDSITGTVKLYTCALAVVAAGRRSSVRQHRWIADALAIAIDQHSTDELIDTFAGII